MELILRDASFVGRPSVLHTSGAISGEILAPLRGFGMSVGSCHPLQTFQSPARAVESLKSSYFCIEGDPKACRAARRFVNDIGARYFEVPGDLKGLYHAGAVLASGGIVTLLSFSIEVLSQCGLTESEARKVLLPLVEGTLANIGAGGPARALTGPVRRGDAGTVERNLQALSAANRSAADLYRLLTKRAVSLAEEAGVSPDALATLRRLVDEASGVPDSRIRSHFKS
jgi:predicted short-subunit dehydrogenase-like oxidoreductase (DUF2520 family)